MLASEPVGGRSRVTELPCFYLFDISMSMLYRSRCTKNVLLDIFFFKFSRPLNFTILINSRNSPINGA